MPHTSRVLLIIAALLALTLDGCCAAKMNSRGSLSATSFQMTRRVGTPPQSAGAPTVNAGDSLRADGNQKLVADLNSGLATFTDADGRSYVTHIDPTKLQELKGIVTSRTWEVGERTADKNVTEPTWYSLTVYNGDKPASGRASWVRPESKETKHPLPPAITTLEETFERVSRIAHPLSENVDLLN
ncbi:MAG: hypothetical protein IT444_12905 [Phycisphaeraceae bacterium]|nr:hypothetical protein [Phycisphaeraceae bacterium]